jgi:hypothetical protein
VGKPCKNITVASVLLTGKMVFSVDNSSIFYRKLIYKA